MNLITGPISQTENERIIIYTAASHIKYVLYFILAGEFAFFAV